MPIYEYYCPENNKIYQFFAKSLVQGQRIPKCPDNPGYSMQKMISSFAITGGAGEKESDADGAINAQAGGDAGDPQLEAAMNAMDSEFSALDENDPRALGRAMRRMAEMAGEKIDGEMEEVVRKLEEGTDPEKLEEQLGGSEGPDEAGDPYGEMGGAPATAQDPKEPRKAPRSRRSTPVRDPKLYDYE